MTRRVLAAAVGAALLAGCAGPAAAPAPPAEPAPRSVQARWWEWAAAEPPATNPVMDRTGASCDRNQPSDVWFLAGTFGGRVRRQCTVPAGRPIIAPVVNLVGGREDCADLLSTAEGVVSVDGTDVPLERREFESVTFTAKPGNPVSDESGEVRTGACGLWARIEAPARGEHRVRIHGSSGDLVVDVDYDLVVA